MRILLLVCLLQFLFNSELHSQEKTFTFGPTIGAEFPFNVGNGSDNNVRQLYIPVRPQIGMAFNISFSDMLGVQPELLYQYRTIEYDDFNNNLVSFTYDLLLIPIMVDLKLAQGFSLQGGPRIGVVFSDNSDDVIGGTGLGGSYLQPSAEVAIMFGPQYKLPFGLFFNLRGEYTVVGANNGGLTTAGVIASMGWLF